MDRTSARCCSNGRRVPAPPPARASVDAVARFALGAAVALGVLAAADRRSGAAAEPEAASAYHFDGSVSGGYRMVDIDGSKDKYREDYDLRSGGRLFGFIAGAASSRPDTTPVDRLRIEIDGPGDEPYSHYRLVTSDRGRFDLRASFTRSRYFYAVPRLFEASVPDVVPTDDLHSFDVVRTNGAVDLTVHSSKLPVLRLGYRLYDVDAGSRTVSTVRIPGGDTFLVQAPSSNVANVVIGGTTFKLLDADVSLEQRYRWTDRHLKQDDPLNSGGLDPTDASTLEAYASRGDDRIDTPMTTVRVRRTIGERLDVDAGYFFSRASMDFDRRQTSTGTSNVPSYSGTLRTDDDGDSVLTTHVADLGTTVRVSERIRLHSRYRFNERRQDGSVDEAGTFGALAVATDDRDRSHEASSEIEVEPRDDLLLGAGVRYRHRHAAPAAAADVTTDTVGAIARVRYRPRSYLDLFARYENVQIDDPLRVTGDERNAPPLPGRETILTFVNRGALGFRLTPRPWGRIDYQFSVDRRDNDTFNGNAHTLGNSVTLTLDPRPDLTFLVSYTRRLVDGRADILIAPLYQRTTSEQDGTENTVVSVMRYDFRLLGQRWASGWSVSYVDTNDTLRPRLEEGGRSETRYDLDRVDAGWFLTWAHRLIEPTIEFRYIDYTQRPLAANDYRATILVLKATKRFDF